MRRNGEVDSMDEWYQTLGEHDPRPDPKVLETRIQSLSRQRWGIKKEGNIAFESAVEDGYLTEDGEVTPKGRTLLLENDALQRERMQSAAKKKNALNKPETKRETAPKPQDMIFAVFDSHGMSIPKNCLSVEIDDRMINSGTKNYRVTFYSKSNSSMVGMFRGTLAQILGVVDEQAVLLSESINGMPERRPKKKKRDTPQEESVYSAIG